MSEISDAVIEAQQAFWTALKTRDAALFDEVLAPSFTAVAPDRTRAEFIATLTTFPGDVLSVDADDIQVRLFDEFAVLTCTQRARVRLGNGLVVSDTLALTNVFMHDNGRWRLALARPVQLTEN